MSRAVSAILSISVVVAGALVPAQAADDASARWWAHVSFLANDDLQGRDTGSEGHKKAAAYVAEQFKAAGLAPAGTSGYLQPVPFTSRQIVEAQSSLALVRDGKVEPVALGPDAAFSMRIDPAPQVEAPLVFVGYGLSIPELTIDDFAGQDLRGKVVVYLLGSPAGVPDALSAHAQSAAVRWAALKKAGALGAIVLQHPGRIEPPWERSTLARLQPAMSLADPALDDTAGQQVSIAFNPASAERLFAGSGHTFAEMLALADARKPLPRFALPTVVRAKVTVDKTTITSDNVAGTLVGSDPALRDEYVVLSAHLDHLGVGGAVERRPDLQRRDGQRLRHRQPDRDRRGTGTRVGEAEALGPVRRGDRRGEGAARLALLRHPSARAARGPSSPTSTWTCSCRCSR